MSILGGIERKNKKTWIFQLRHSNQRPDDKIAPTTEQFVENFPFLNAKSLFLSSFRKTVRGQKVVVGRQIALLSATTGTGGIFN